jgi:hypothetical protein
MITAAICFALIAVLVKQVKHLPLMEIVLFRNIPMMIIISGMIKKGNIPPFGNNKPILILSGLVIRKRQGDISFVIFKNIYLLC